MHAYSYTFQRHHAKGRGRPRQWRMRREWSLTSQLMAYLAAMAPTDDARKEAFSRWTKRVVAHAKLTRNWSVTKIAEVAGIGDQTIYRWMNKEWSGRGPQPDQIVAFCDALDVTPDEPFKILWPGKKGAAPAAEPLAITDPDLLLLAQRLADPNVDDIEKWYIQQQLQQLVARPKQPTTRPGRNVGRPRKTS